MYLDYDVDQTKPEMHRLIPLLVGRRTGSPTISCTNVGPDVVVYFMDVCRCLIHRLVPPLWLQFVETSQEMQTGFIARTTFHMLRSACFPCGRAGSAQTQAWCQSGPNAILSRAGPI